MSEQIIKSTVDESLNKLIEEEMEIMKDDLDANFLAIEESLINTINTQEDVGTPF